MKSCISLTPQGQDLQELKSSLNNLTCSVAASGQEKSHEENNTFLLVAEHLLPRDVWFLGDKHPFRHCALTPSFYNAQFLVFVVLLLSRSARVYRMSRKRPSRCWLTSSSSSVTSLPPPQLTLSQVNNSQRDTRLAEQAHDDWSAEKKRQVQSTMRSFFMVK